MANRARSAQKGKAPPPARHTSAKREILPRLSLPPGIALLGEAKLGPGLLPLTVKTKSRRRPSRTP